MSGERRVEALGPESAVRQRWKNGRGETEELAIWPRGASWSSGEGDARLSTARVSESGPFSHFPGFERVLVVVDGDRLLLTHGADAPRARLRRLEPYRFPGEWTTSGELVGAALRDFNVFTRRGVLRADVQAVQLGRRRLREPLEATHAFVHVLSGALTARVTGEEAPFELGARSSLRIDCARAVDELDLAGAAEDAAVIVVRLIEAENTARAPHSR
jgi:environmental stress-induced protein Ves